MKQLLILLLVLLSITCAGQKILPTDKLITPLVKITNSTVAPIPSSLGFLYAISDHLYWGTTQLDHASVIYTATSPIAISANDVRILTDTLYQWRMKQNKGATAFGWGQWQDTLKTRIYQGNGILISGTTPSYTIEADTSVLATQYDITQIPSSQWTTEVDGIYYGGKVGIGTSTMTDYQATIVGGAYIDSTRTNQLDIYDAGNSIIVGGGTSAGSLTPKMYLPAKIHVTTEQEFNLWWDALSLYQPSDNIRFKVKCSMPGLWVLNRGIRIPWETTTGSYPITIYAKSSDNTIIDSVSSTIEVVAANAGTGHYNILMIGDSRTWQNISNQNGYGYTGGGGGRTITTQLNTLVSYYPTISVSMIGTQGTDPTKNEGYSGWHLGQFLGASSPFYYGGRIDFKSYMAEHYPSNDTIHVATIMMGVNDIWTAVTSLGYTNLYDTAVGMIPLTISRFKTLVDDLTDPTYGYPDCKIILVLEPTTSSQSGFGYWYGSVENNGTLEQWACENALRELRRQLISTFDTGAYSHNVTLSIAGLEADRTYGYPYMRSRSSLRANDTTEILHVNSIHPHDVGYKQIADGIYATLRYVISDTTSPPPLNPDLILNGNFANTDNWSLQSPWTVSGNAAHCDGSNGNIWQVVAITGATQYELTYTATITSGTLYSFMGGLPSTVNGTGKTVSGTYTETLTSPATPYGSIGFQGDFVGSVTNVQFRLK